jgi:hypothetical protein
LASRNPRFAARRLMIAIMRFIGYLMLLALFVAGLYR